MKYLLTFIFFIWSGGAYLFHQDVRSFSTPPLGDKKADAIVVLTGRSHRLAVGIQLLEQKISSRLFITGVNLKISQQKIKNIFKTHHSIELGYKALNTKGNAVETKEWIHKNNINSICLVTDNLHMPRALLEFRQLLSIPIKPYPAYKKSFSWSKFFVEFHKYLFALIRTKLT